MSDNIYAVTFKHGMPVDIYAHVDDLELQREFVPTVTLSPPGGRGEREPVPNATMSPPRGRRKGVCSYHWNDFALNNVTPFCCLSHVEGRHQGPYA